MADQIMRGEARDPATNTGAYFYITYDDVTFDVSSVRIDNQTPRIAKVWVYPPTGGSMAYEFAPNTDTTRNLPGNARYNLDTWGYAYGLLG